jgi:hypothetical protein
MVIMTIKGIIRVEGMTLVKSGKIIGSQALTLILPGDRIARHLMVIGKAPMLKKAIQHQDWMQGPAHEDSIEIPPRAMCFIRTILLKGCNPRDL